MFVFCTTVVDNSLSFAKLSITFTDNWSGALGRTAKKLFFYETTGRTDAPPAIGRLRRAATFDGTGRGFAAGN